MYLFHHQPQYGMIQGGQQEGGLGGQQMTLGGFGQHTGGQQDEFFFELLGGRGKLGFPMVTFEYRKLNFEGQQTGIGFVTHRGLPKHSLFLQSSANPFRFGQSHDV